MEERHPVVTLLRKNLVLLLFFVFFNITAYFFTFMEDLNKCFPATVITTDKTIVESIIDELDLCSMTVDSEKMTFDSAIFNHYEVPPVKDVYLYSLSFPYEKWDRIKNLDNALSDTNPYVEKTVVAYNGARIKLFSTGFVIIFALWLIFTARIAPSWKRSRRAFFTTAASTLIFFMIFSAVSFALASPEIHSFITISLSVLIVTYTVILSIIYRFISTGEHR